MLDIKNAYLMVPQSETVLIKISRWMKRIAKIGEGVSWLLMRCLPGQRAAAREWCEYFRNILENLGFVFSQRLPALGKHKTKKLLIFIHVDDEMLARKEEPTEWLISELEKHFRVEKEGPFPVGPKGDGEEVSYLKRKYVFLPEGIVVHSSEKYVKALVEVYGLGKLKEKATPEHPDLMKEDRSRECTPEAAKKSRSGVASILYLSQDRVDIQFATKALASAMSKPTQQAVKCLKHLILCLKGASARAVLLPYVAEGQKVISELNGSTSEAENICVGVFEQ